MDEKYTNYRFQFLFYRAPKIWKGQGVFYISEIWFVKITVNCEFFYY